MVSQLPERSSRNRTLIFTLVLVGAVLAFMVALFGTVLSNLAIGLETQSAFQRLNLIDRQQTLIATVQKDLYRVRDERRTGKISSEAMNDLTSGSSLVAATFKGFAQGAVAEDESGHRLYIEPLEVVKSRDLAAHAYTIWAPIEAKLAGLGSNPSPAQLDAAVDAARPANELIDLTGSIRDETVEASTQNLAALSARRLTQLIVSILCFVLIVTSLFQRVNESQRQVREFADSLQVRNSELAANARQLADAKRGTDLIMETVNQGLMLIDPQYRIQPQYSRELETILQTPELAGQNFLNILQRTLTERMYTTSRDYLTLLFDAKKKERTVLKVNPLDEVEVSFASPQGGFVNKYLAFSFRRIIEAGVVTRVFVAVSDVSERVALERQLRESEAKKDRQFDFLLGILHVDQRLLDEFVANAREQIARMNEALRSEDFARAAGGGHMDQLRARLDVVFRSVHGIKGNASLLRLDHFQRQCEAFENKIAELKNRATLTGDDFLAVVIAQSELRTDLDELEELRSRFQGVPRVAAAPGPAAPVALIPPQPPTEFARPPEPAHANGSAAHAAPPAAPPVAAPAAPAHTDPLIATLDELVGLLGSRLGKEVRLDARGFDTTSLDEGRRRVVMDVLAQLTRNSIAHGIESASDRIAAGKAAVATITVRDTGSTSHDFRFLYRDDGAGLDPERIRRRAADLGLLSPEDAAALDDGGVAALIFMPGFSTSDAPTPDAGRGMGMNVVKDRVVDECGGEIAVSSEPGRYCEFEFSLPAPELAVRTS
jgi:HPt (histidine-containing phosphotransfer) domain-containing protein/two-component sensor histidine kinase